jgi:hypothetical protein
VDYGKSLIVALGVCPSNRRRRAHGAYTGAARREEEAMSMHIVEER